MAKRSKTAAQKKAKTLWDGLLKDHIVGFISPSQGQHRKSLTRVKKAMEKGNFDRVKDEFAQLRGGKKKTRNEGFLAPVFVKKEVKPTGERSLPDGLVKVGKKVYLLPGSKLSRKLRKAWEEFLGLVVKLTVNSPSQSPRKGSSR